MKRLFGFFSRVATHIESMQMSPAEWMSTFLCISIVRFFLEAFSSRNVTGYLASDATTNAHFVIFYLVMVLSLALLMSVMTERPFAESAKIALAGLPLIWVAPLVDLAVTGGWRMAYIFEHPYQLFINFLTFFGPIKSPGVTLGIKVELAILLLLVIGYVYMRTASKLRSVGAGVVAYVIIFISGAFPSLLMIGAPQTASVIQGWWMLISQSLIGFTALHPDETFTSIRTFEVLFDIAMLQCWYLVLLVLVATILWRSTPRVFTAVMRNIRPPRLAHYLGLVVIGGYVAYSLEPFHRVWVLLDGVTILVALFSISLAWVCAVSSNDLADESIDSISNDDRPLIRGEMNKSEMKNIAVGAGALAILGAYSLGSYSLYFIAMYTAVAFIYSMPPLRLKRIPFLATFLLSLACLSATMFGFFLVSQDRQLEAFPSRLALLIVIAFTLGMNWKDLKDIKGDAANGIMTLPTILGEQTGRMVIGGMLFTSFMLVPVFSAQMIFIIPSAIAGLMLWVGVVQGRGSRFVFGVFFMAILILLGMFELFR